MKKGGRGRRKGGEEGKDGEMSVREGKGWRGMGDWMRKR